MRLDSLLALAQGKVRAGRWLPWAEFGNRPDGRLWALAVVAALLILLFLTIDVQGHWDFVLPRRGRKVVVAMVVGYAISYATVLFQTVTNNRILTPSMIGFDSLYMLIQTVVVFAFGALALTTMPPGIRFLINAGLMMGFAGLLYRLLFQREGRYLYFLVLAGIIFGTFFNSFTSFLQRLIDPNDFAVLQDRMFASFNSVPEELLLVAVAGVLAATGFSLRDAHRLDVLALGRDHAINLGVEHERVVQRLMLVIAGLIAVSTALVGPITFFGLLVANLAYTLMPTYRHRYVIPAAALLGIIALVGAHLLVDRVFTFSTSLSVIINFIGGSYFIFMVLKESRA